MTSVYLVLREIRHRSAGFGLAVLVAAIAAGTLGGSLALLRSHDRATRIILQQKADDLESRLELLDDDVRRSMLHLGFTITILPEGQALDDWYADDYASKDMPDSTLQQLIDANVMTIEHLVPRLRAKLKWSEQKRTIILVGTGDSIGRPSEQARELVPDRVPAGQVDLGHEIHQALGILPGESIRILDHELRVRTCRNQAGTKDDITVWTSLADAQAILDKPGRINEILAIQCRAAWNDLPAIRREITRILPGCQVVEKASPTLALIHARTKLEEQGRAAIAREHQRRLELRNGRQRLGVFLTLIALTICAVWMWLLASANVRDRQQEIGILRTIGYRTAQILWLFLLRSSIIGLFGGALGFFTAYTALAAAGDGTAGSVTADFDLFVLTLLIATGVTLAGTWVPSRRAAAQDPATVLSEA